MNKLVIEKVLMKNFRGTKNLELEFPDNKFILITGRNGSGKTTCIDAICWALWDEDTGGRRGDTVVNVKAKRNCSVELTFSINDVRYVVKNYRKHTKYKNSKYLLKNGEDISGDTSRETTKLLENLIMPKKVFFTCMMFSNLIKEPFAELNYSKQKEILDKILGFDKYVEYQEIFKELIKTKSNRLPTIETLIDTSKNEIKSHNKNITELQEYIEEAEIEHKLYIKDIDSKIEKYKHKLNTVDCDKLYEKMKKINEKEDEKRHELLKFVTQIETLNESIVNKEQEFDRNLEKEKENISVRVKSEYNNSINKLKEELSNLKVAKMNSTVDMRAKKDEWERSILTLKNNLASQRVEYKTLTDSFKEFVETCKYNKNRLLNDEQRINESIKRDTESFEKYSLNIEVCDKCNSVLNEKKANELYEQNKLEHEQNIKRYNDELKSIKQQLDDIVKEYNTRKLNTTKKQEDIKILGDEYKSELDNLEKQLKQLDSDLEDSYKNFDEQINKTQNEIQKLIEQYKLDVKNEESEIHETLKKNFDEELNKIRETISQYNKSIELNETFIKEKIEPYKVKIQNNIEMYEKLGDTIKQTEKDKENKIEYYNKLKQERDNNLNIYKSKVKEYEKNITECENELSVINEELEIITFWRKGFSDVGIPGIIMDEIVTPLNKIISGLTDMIDDIRISFDSTRETKTGDSRNKFEFKAIHQTKLSTYEMFSAGESKITDIIVLLSLRYLREQSNNISINLVMFDEILDNLDQENSEIVVNMLQKLKLDHCVLLISHVLKDWIEVDDVLQMSANS